MAACVGPQDLRHGMADLVTCRRELHTVCRRDHRLQQASLRAIHVWPLSIHVALTINPCEACCEACEGEGTRRSPSVSTVQYTLPFAKHLLYDRDLTCTYFQCSWAVIPGQFGRLSI